MRPAEQIKNGPTMDQEKNILVERSWLHKGLELEITDDLYTEEH